ncbi:hypothetical protein AAE478_008832 [Parahypoxylon ruwenzoriense]
MAHINPLDDLLLSLPGSWPALPSRICNGSRQPSGSGEAGDSITAPTDSDEQLKEAKHEIRKLKRTLASNSKTAERSVEALLRDKCRLQEALERSEKHSKKLTEEYKQLREIMSVRMAYIFDAARQSRAESERGAGAQQESTANLSTGSGTTTQATQTEGTQSEDISSLRYELEKARTRFYDERKITQMLSQQTQEMDGLTQTQHSEIKRQQETIKDLKQSLNILRDELEQGHGKSICVENTYVDRGVGDDEEPRDAMKDKICRLRKEVSISAEKNQSLQAQLENEQQAVSELRLRISRLEKQKASTADDRTPDKPNLWAMKARADQLRQQQEKLADTQVELAGPVKNSFASEEEMIRSQQRPPEIKAPSSPKANGIKHNGQRMMADGLEHHGANGAITALRDRVSMPKKTNGELGEEVRYYQSRNAKPTSVYQLDRADAEVPVPILPPSPDATQLLRVSQEEEIPELRLPSPVASLEKKAGELGSPNMHCVDYEEDEMPQSLSLSTGSLERQRSGSGGSTRSEPDAEFVWSYQSPT